LSQDLQLVSFTSKNFYCKFVNYLNLGHLWNGFWKSITNSRGSYPCNSRR
jgi:hypothetical protein